MRRYFITERWVLNKEILMPITMIARNNMIILVLSCNFEKLGINNSITHTVTHTATIAMREEINPFMMALILIGRAIKPLVAPTICMVLIKNRLLYMASLMVLSMENTTNTVNKIAAIRNMMAAVFT